MNDDEIDLTSPSHCPTRSYHSPLSPATSRDMVTESPIHSTFSTYYPKPISWQPSCARCNYYKTEVEICKEECCGFRKQLQESTREISTLKQEISDHQHTRQREIDQASKALETLTLQVNSVEIQVSQLSQTLSSRDHQLQSQAEQISALLQQKSALNDQLRQKDERFSALQDNFSTQLRSQAERITALNKQISAQSELITNLNDQVEQNELAREELLNQNNAFKSQIDTQTKSYEVLKRSNHSLTIQYLNSREQIEKLQTEARPQPNHHPNLPNASSLPTTQRLQPLTRPDIINRPEPTPLSTAAKLQPSFPAQSPVNKPPSSLQPIQTRQTRPVGSALQDSYLQNGHVAATMNDDTLSNKYHSSQDILDELIAGLTDSPSPQTLNPHFPPLHPPATTEPSPPILSQTLSPEQLAQQEQEQEQDQDQEGERNNKLIAIEYPNYAFLTDKRPSLPDHMTLSQSVAHYNHNFVALETGHGFIQWFFPTCEKSQFNSRTKSISWEELTFLRGNSDIQHNVIILFNMILEFWGFEVQIQPNSPTQTLPTSLLVSAQSLSDQLQTYVNSKLTNPQFQRDFQKAKTAKDQYYHVPPTSFSQMQIQIVPHHDCQFRIDRFSNFLTNTHNDLRMTRVMNSLRLIGLDNFCSAFYNALFSITQPRNHKLLCPPPPPFNVFGFLDPEYRRQEKLHSDSKYILERITKTYLRNGSPFHKFWAPIVNDHKTIQLLDHKFY